MMTKDGSDIWESITDENIEKSRKQLEKEEGKDVAYRDALFFLKGVHYVIHKIRQVAPKLLPKIQKALKEETEAENKLKSH